MLYADKLDSLLCDISYFAIRFNTCLALEGEASVSVDTELIGVARAGIADVDA